jgi:hypothetical protein
VVERPTTQNLIGKAKTLQRKKLGEGNAPIWLEILYLSSVIDNETSAPPSWPNCDLLHVNSSVSTSNNNHFSAYSVFDCGASNHYMDTANANPFILKHRRYRCMTASGAGDVKAEED